MSVEILIPPEFMDLAMYGLVKFCLEIITFIDHRIKIFIIQINCVITKST